MVRPEIWGPPIWRFFHVLAEKIKESEFKRIYHPLFILIQRICSYLPCPECSQHATQFLRKININQIDSKDKFRGMLYVFHNIVNLRKRKNPFNVENLVNYRKIRLINAFNEFVQVYNTKGNMNMIAESFQRSLLLKDLRNWLMVNYNAFDDNINIINETKQMMAIIVTEKQNEEKCIDKKNIENNEFNNEFNNEVNNEVKNEIQETITINESDNNKNEENDKINNECIIEETIIEEAVTEETVIEEPITEETPEDNTVINDIKKSSSKRKRRAKKN